MAALRRSFRIGADAEMSIEVDPRTVTPARLGHLRALGFNRISFGVQDFDAAVRRRCTASNRSRGARADRQRARARLRSINADLIYGLPGRRRRASREPWRRSPSCGRTGSRSTRTPTCRSVSSRSDGSSPTTCRTAPRVAHAGGAVAGFLAAATTTSAWTTSPCPTMRSPSPSDKAGCIAISRATARSPTATWSALGVSAIGRLGATYQQNAKTLPEYYAALGQGRLPVVRGLTLGADDVLRRDVIMALMCQGRRRVRNRSSRPRHRLLRALRRRARAARAAGGSGLVNLHADAIEVTASGWFLVRAVAMVFDRHLHADPARNRFSRIV